MSTFISDVISDCLDNIAARRSLCDALVARGWGRNSSDGDPNPDFVRLGRGDYVCAVGRDASIQVRHVPAAAWWSKLAVATVHRPRPHTRTWRARMVAEVERVVAVHAAALAATPGPSNT